MNKIIRITIVLLMTAGAVFTSGCATGIVGRPDLSKLVYDDNGVLRYDGKRVEGIKLELPWYQEMWPDNAAEWSFTIATAGVSALAASGDLSGGGGGGESSTTVQQGTPTSAPQTTTTSSPTRRKPDPDSSTTTTTTTSSDSGGGGGSAPPAPPPGGGDELPG